MFRPTSAYIARNVLRDVIRIAPETKEFVVYHTFFPFTSGIELLYVPFKGPIVGLFPRNKMFVDLREEKDRYAIDKYATQHGIDEMDLKEPVLIRGTMKWHEEDLGSESETSSQKKTDDDLTTYLATFG